MGLKYTDERNAQILISLLKKYNIRKVIISPGTSNVCFAGSLLNDPFFELYSSVDERSAAYIACGIAAECGEPVVLSCTGATSSRNYMPGLTEAYYRKLPILAVTSSQRSTRIGHNIDQVTDRLQLPRDVAKISVQLPVIFDDEMEWACVISANKALSELRHRGGGPVHINLETNYSSRFNVETLPETRMIHRFVWGDVFPEINYQKIAIVVGAHLPWSDDLQQAVDDFCEKYGCIVICDHTSNYKGKYKVLANILSVQNDYVPVFNNLELLIHIGDISASKMKIGARNTWRINPDGEMRDTFRSLTCVFECEEINFFSYYCAEKKERIENKLFKECDTDFNEIIENVPELPFSNIWLARTVQDRLPKNSVLHLAIRNSFRSWNFFDIPDYVSTFCNTGGFGIDGCVSSTIGASFCDKNKIYYCVTGDLAFFYDMNALGNRHIGNNVRILMVNNGTAMEMRFKSNLTSKFEGNGDSYLAATGHYGHKSEKLVRHYAEDLGFDYYSVKDKVEFESVLPKFVSSEMLDKPMLIEVFTNSDDEENALQIISSIKASPTVAIKNNAKKKIKGILGDNIIDAFRRQK